MKNVGQIVGYCADEKKHIFIQAFEIETAFAAYIFHNIFS